MVSWYIDDVPMLLLPSQLKKVVEGFEVVTELLKNAVDEFLVESESADSVYNSNEPLLESNVTSLLVSVSPLYY